MTEPTTAAQRERWLKDLEPYLGKPGHGQSEIMARLVADIKRITGERDRLQSAFDTQQGWLNECQAELKRKP